MEAIRIAEEREQKVKACFDKYDIDASGTIEMEELLQLLDDLGIYQKVGQKGNPTDFAADMFHKYDANDDGVLDFEEVQSMQPPCIVQACP